MRALHKSRYLSCGVLFFFLFFISGDVVPQGDQGKLSFAELLDQGKKLYAEKDYENAVIRLLQARPLAATDAEIIEINFVLSRVYFDIDERDAARSCMRKMLELSPEKFSDEKTVSSGWRKLFQEVKRASEDDSPQIAGMRFRKELKRHRRFSKYMLIGSLVLLAGAGIALAIIGRKKKIKVEPDYDTRAMKIEWVTVPAGDFLMGDNFGDGDPDERPVHAVYLDKYEISKFEITYEQFDLFCRESKRSMTANPNETVRGTRPVLVNNWNEARDFCLWLSEKTGKKIFLPTEAQWEKAARGPDQRKYPWGNAEPNCGIVNFGNCVSGTQPVGSYPAGGSPYGVMDMAGNAKEWCGDYYDDDFYGKSPRENPSLPLIDSSIGNSGGNPGQNIIVFGYIGSLCVARGGDYKSNSSDIRTAKREGINQFTNGIGFRIGKK